MLALMLIFFLLWAAASTGYAAFNFNMNKTLGLSRLNAWLWSCFGSIGFAVVLVGIYFLGGPY